MYITYIQHVVIYRPSTISLLKDMIKTANAVIDSNIDSNSLSVDAVLAFTST